MKQENILVKISYKNLTKIECVNNYEQLINKIYQHFSLASKTYYHLYYAQPSVVSITCAQSFQKFISNPNKLPKLILDVTQNPQLHFTGNPQPIKSYEQNNEKLQQQLDKLKEEMKQKLEEAKENLTKQIKEELNQQQQAMKSKKTQAAKVKNIGFECRGCKSKDFKGIRYQCAICDYNLCEDCQYSGKEHKEHPLIKIKDPSIRIQFKKNTLVTQVRQQKAQKSKQQAKLTTQLMQFLSISEEKARKVVSSNPSKDLNELVEIYFSQH